MPETFTSVELRCSRHLHGVLQVVPLAKRPPTQPHSVYVKQCRQCSRDMGRPVVHRWDAVTGEMIEGDEVTAA